MIFEMLFFMLASDNQVISSLRRAFHFSYWALLSLDKPKESSKTEETEAMNRKKTQLSLEILKHT